ncbi:DUF1631 family protein [Gilvimarinus sp. DA14]|uniref:DUF1631 family protein n=1 Tax=Gilvimarinus sp. DA14 TaxID=2956798 RepID=UPI0020B89EEA|nr:DUF1631 family protein [Gilvimarinus sp. DA14]UTF61836.1 DUF1631 domain-containing protein [Gilvimarinus sp. DA14]
MSKEPDRRARAARLCQLLDCHACASEASAAELMAVPQAVLEADDSWQAYAALPLAPKAGLAGLHAAWFWAAMRSSVDCDPALMPRVQRLGAVLVAHVARDASLELSELRQRRRAWDSVFYHLQTWCESLWPQGGKFLQRLEALVASLEAGEDEEQALGLFNQACNKELDRAALLAERMQASELGRIRAAHAEHQVTELYNQTVAGRQLPESVLAFIQQQLTPALQYVLINDSDQSAVWSFWTRMLRLMVWTLNPDKSAEDRQAFFNKGPAMLSQLEQAEPPPSCSPAEYQGFVADISALIISLLKGLGVETATADARAVNSEAQALKQLQAAGQTHHFSTGDWLEFHGETTLRCQFLLQAPGTDQLLFVNRNGQKALQKSAAQMRACLDADIAREIAQIPVVSAAITAANGRLGQLEALYESRAIARAAAREAELERQQQLAAARAREAAARQEAQAKARAEAERLAAEAEAARLRRQQQQEAERQAAHEQKVRDDIDNLTLGTWADLPSKDGRSIRCKLAVSMRSTGKYIFVDRVGSKVAELHYDELLAMALAGKAVFYPPEQRFENRLETIVRGLRRTE